jgi:hypothetical protein
MLSAPQSLAYHHQIADLASGEPSLDDWLSRCSEAPAKLRSEGGSSQACAGQLRRAFAAAWRRAAKNQANGSSRAYAVCEGETVIGC